MGERMEETEKKATDSRQQTGKELFNEMEIVTPG
jgi:hypothetical protein